MITVKTKGGLGNQLFQYAIAYQLFREFGFNINLDIDFFKSQFSNLFKLEKFNIPFSINENFIAKNSLNKYIKIINDFIYYKNNFWLYPGSNEINLDLLKNPFWKIKNLSSNSQYLISGWMQNTSYIEKYRNDLSDLYWLKPEYENQSELKDLIQNANSVSVHIRRGDMVKNSNFNIIEKDYYLSAVEHVLTNTIDPQFYIFSDEPEEAKQLFPKISNSTFISENSKSMGYYGTHQDYQDFQLMRYCQHHIIANSTFSWWPAYLNLAKDNIVIAPKIWYKNSVLQNQFSKSSLLQKEWIII